MKSVLMMSVRSAWKLLLMVSICLILFSAAGCSDQRYQVADVDGVLVIAGQPGYKMLIEFIPDIDHGTSGPISTAQTDQEGRFTLTLNGGPGASTQMGAVVGQHRVTLSDLQMSESATGAGIPVRVPPNYALPGSTPLVQVVQPGRQTLTISLP